MKSIKSESDKSKVEYTRDEMFVNANGLLLHYLPLSVITVLVCASGFLRTHLRTTSQSWFLFMATNSNLPGGIS